MFKNSFGRKNSFIILTLMLFAATSNAAAQNTNSSNATTRRQTTTTTTTTTRTSPSTSATQDTTEAAPAATPATSAARRSRTGRGRAQSATTNTDAATRTAVRAAFDALIDGITRSDAEAVMALYWNSPQLVVFNNNGTTTRTWTQVHSNRTSLYQNVRDVKLATSNVTIQPLGADAAVVTALWTQAQTYKGVPESATGRMTLVFRRLGTDWKIVHAHTSPDAPDPSRLLPSEQRETTTTTTTTTTPATTPAPSPGTTTRRPAAPTATPTPTKP